MGVDQWIMGHEPDIHLGFFFGVLALIALWEILAPRRPLTVPKAKRWTNNRGLVFLNTLLLRLLFPAAAVGMAAFSAQQWWGLLNYIDASFWVAVAVSVIAMDFVIYLQHVMVHAVPALWRLHRRARFHPIEIILSMLIKFATIGVLGPPVVAVVIFEVLLNATAMFNHGNLRLPRSVDRILRWLVVTPDMHRVHHSVEDDEANSNFGFNLPWRDRLLGTYGDQPRGGHEGMTIGIHGYRDPKQVDRLPGMLALPFVGGVSGYAINRRQWTPPTDGGTSNGQ